MAVLGLFAFAAVPAAAENAHVLIQTIAGKEATALSRPSGVAVDGSSGASNGDVYVADTRNNRIVKFSAAGAFLRMWGRAVNEGTGNPGICTNAGFPTDSCGPGTSFASGPGSLTQVRAIAVDSSSGPSAGDVYAAGGTTEQGGNVVEKFDPSGELVASYGGSPFPGAITVGGNSGNGGVQSISVDSAGNLYAFSEHKVFKFSPSGTLLATTTSPLPSYFDQALAVDGSGNYFQVNGESAAHPRSIEKFSPAGADLGQVDTGDVRNAGLAYETSSDELLASYSSFPNAGVRAYRFNGAGEVIQADSTTCAPAALTGCGPSETFGNEDLSPNEGGPEGIAVDSATHKVYVANGGANDIKVYELIDAPKMTTPATSNLTRTSVTFSAHVDPDGAGQVTSCRFEYGPTREYETGSAACTPATTAIPADVSAQLPAGTLAPGTTYHYRLVVGNASGDRPGGDQTFTTPPAVGGVVTAAATNVDRMTATLNGSFLGDGVDTSYHFEYGPTASYGSTTPDVDWGTATSAQSVSANVAHLIAYSTYHYRLVAHNEYGTSFGSDQELLTLAPELPTVQTTYTSAVDQDSAVVNAQIDPGSGLTVYRFEYGTSASYGSRSLVAGPIDPDGPGRTASAELTELAAGTTYHFRVLATNFSGTTAGPDQTFTTSSLPVVLSSAATGVTETSATLGALVNPSLSLTTYHFDYGGGSGYGFRTPESTPFGPDDAAHAAAAALSGLAPGAVYHFRVVATNGLGTTYGTDQTFTTLAPPPPAKAKSVAKKCRKGLVKKKGRCVRKKAGKHAKKHKDGGRSNG